MVKKNKQNKIQNFTLKEFKDNLWYLIGDYKKKFNILILFGFLVATISLIDPYIVKLIIDSLINFNPDDTRKIIFLVFLMFIANRIAATIIYFFDKNAIKLVIDIEYDLPIRAHEKMLYLPLSYHEKENTGNKIIKIRNGVDRLVQLLSNIFWDIAPTFFRTLVTATVLFVVDYRFGLLFIVSVPSLVIITLKGNKLVSPQRKNRQDGYEDAAGKMTQSIININTVKSFTQEEREKASLRETAETIKNNSYLEFFTMFKYGVYRGFVVDLSLVIIICFGIYLILQGQITVGSLVFVITISQKALLSLFRISRIYDRVMEAYEPLKRIKALLEKKSNILNKVDSLKAKNLKGDILFENVNFSYDGSSEKVLHNVNLKIEAGSTVALIGPSGGGKTTSARMIYRHYDPQQGKVSIDGVDLRDYDLYSFRSHIAIVPQEVDIFSASITENISYGKPRATMKEVEAAAEIANATEFIEKLHDGYKTEVGERGIKLSGGQRQRIGIARAILANPKILIFDEATSNLDSYSEKLIQSSLEKITKNRTVIIIAHRLSTIKKADKIVVLENGKIVEEGIHAELSKKDGGLYSKLLKLQEIGEIAK